MAGHEHHIGIVQIGHPGPPDGDGDTYWRSGLGARLLSMYGERLGLHHIYIGYHSSCTRTVARRRSARVRAVRPAASVQEVDRPDQMHLDVAVGDIEGRNVWSCHGASVLRRADDHLVLADPFGHPFCLYPRDSQPGRIVRNVIDCFSPRAPAAFYAELLDMHEQVLDTPQRVDIAGGTQDVVLAFQHAAGQSPRWPDPASLRSSTSTSASTTTPVATLPSRLGAIRLPVPGRPDHLVHADPGGHPSCPARRVGHLGAGEGQAVRAVDRRKRVRPQG